MTRPVDSAHPIDRAHPIDPEFAALPLTACADAALARAAELGASHADVRIVSTRTATATVRDARPESSVDDVDLGLAVRVIHDGCWGFASADLISVEAAVALAERAVALARVSRPLTTARVELAAEPVHTGTWVSAYDVDPFAVPEAERIALLVDRSAGLLAAAGVDHVDAQFMAVKERVLYADLAGTQTLQQRVRLDVDWTAVAVDPVTGAFESMRTCAPPVGRGFEHLTGGPGCWDFDAELARLPELLAAKVRAPSVTPGRYTLLIDPSNLWLTIHESVGHATELDRALGYEANYAGTSFATPDLLGQLRYGSPLMTVTGDRTVEHGLSTVGWDDEGVAAQSFDLVRDGTLVGYQLDRAMAAEFGLPRSNGCAYADSAGHTAIQRMPNVSLQPDPDGGDVAALAAGIEDGIYVVGDRSWSIDMQRYNFQFTGQRFYRIRSGRIAEQVKDVAYQATTTDFWGSLIALGGPSTYLLGGAFNCGKGQPGQVAPVSHGCPAAVFENVNVLNGAAEAGR
ncbi:MAG: TldD/PmbA family protein [Actinomycetota bacterium]|nr:MAG: TldD/PmbA family protein [Actinomycetota bacterium]